MVQGAKKDIIPSPALGESDPLPCQECATRLPVIYNQCKKERCFIVFLAEEAIQKSREGRGL